MKAQYLTHMIFGSALVIHYLVGDDKKALMLDARETTDYLFKTNAIDGFQVGKNFHDSSVNIASAIPSNLPIMYYLYHHFGPRQAQAIVNWHEGLLQAEELERKIFADHLQMGTL